MSRQAPHAWQSAAVHAQVLAPLPSGTFPGVDESEVCRFVENHANTGSQAGTA